MQCRLDGRFDRVIVRFHFLKLLPAAEVVDDIAYKSTSGKVRQSRIGHLPGVLFAERQKLLRICRGFRRHGRIPVKNQLGLAVRSFVALDRHAEVHQRLGVVQIDVGCHIGQSIRERSVKQTVVSGRVEVFAVDPDHVDGAGAASGLLFPGELGQDVVDIHADRIQRDVVVFLQPGCNRLAEPPVPVFISAPAVEGHPAPAGGFHHRIPVAEIRLFGKRGERRHQAGEAQHQADQKTQHDANCSSHFSLVSPSSFLIFSSRRASARRCKIVNPISAA